MTIFTILLCSIILIPFLERKRNPFERTPFLSPKQYTFWVILFLILIPGLRHEYIGLDTFQYKHMFDSYSVSFNNLFKLGVRTEEGYLLLNKIVHDVSNSFIWMQIVTSAAFIIPMYYIVYKYSKIEWFSLALFVTFIFYYICFNEIRLAVAIGISCLAFNYLVNDEWKKYIITIAIAIFFHHSAAIMLPLVAVKFLKEVKFIYVILFFIGFVIISYYLSSIFSFLNSFQENQYSLDDTTGGYGLFVLQLGTLILALIRKDVLLTERHNLYAFYFIVAAVLLFPICHVNPVMFRLEQYCWVAMLILVPNLISSFKNRFIKYSGIIGYLGISYLTLFLNSFSEKNQIIPYLFFWQ